MRRLHPDTVDDLLEATPDHLAEARAWSAWLDDLEACHAAEGATPTAPTVRLARTTAGPLPCCAA